MYMFRGNLYTVQHFVLRTFFYVELPRTREATEAAWVSSTFAVCCFVLRFSLLARRNLPVGSTGLRGNSSVNLSLAVEQVKLPLRIGGCLCILQAHATVHLHHRRRGFLPRQGPRIGRTRRATPGAWVFRPSPQARPLSECRSRHDEPLSTW